MPEGDPLVVGVDETLERRQGKKIAAKGICPRPGKIQPYPLGENQWTTRWIRVSAPGGGTVGF